MLKALTILAAICCVAFGAPAMADEACSKDLVCASRPQTIVDALQAAGYKASLTKSKVTGNPMIESAASGYNYSIFFYECEKNASCGSLQFQISFEDDGTNTPELANRWNRDKRFGQMSVSDEKTLALAYDVTTVGGLNQKNFADVVDWWAVMLGEVSKFFKEAPATK